MKVMVIQDTINALVSQAAASGTINDEGSGDKTGVHVSKFFSSCTYAHAHVVVVFVSTFTLCHSEMEISTSKVTLHLRTFYSSQSLMPLSPIICIIMTFIHPPTH